MTASDPRIKGWVTSKVTFLEMTAPPDRAKASLPRTGIEVRQAKQPPASFYRYLYERIGEDWTWTGRRLMDDPTLLAIIHDPLVEVNVLWVDGIPAGLAEIDHRSPPDIELGYFGLLPDFVGKGLGSLFLDWAIDRAWSAQPKRFWLHTCDLDHPNALSVYQKSGFVIEKHDQAREFVLHDMPAPRRHGSPIEVKGNA